MIYGWVESSKRWDGMKCKEHRRKKQVQRCLWLKSRYRRLLELINNRKIRTKMVYVYILCVLLPVIITNFVMISNIIRVANNEQRQNVNNMAESIANTIDSAIDSAVFVSVDLYTSKSISNFLDVQYDSPEEYVKAYRTVFDNYVFYASSKHLISNLTFYSDNQTMINGGHYYRIQEITDRDWYQAFIASGQEVFVHTYFNDVIYESQRKRMVSVIRKLNYFGSRTNEKIVKLDLNYDQVNESVKGASYNADVYVCYEQHVLFSNDDAVTKERTRFYETEYVPTEQVQVHKTINLYGGTWEIYVTGYKTNYYEQIRKNLGLIVTLFLVDALIPAFAIGLFSDSITKRVLLLGTYLNQVKEDSFQRIPNCESNDEIGELLENYNLMATRMEELIEYEFKSRLEQQELCLARQQAELLALYSQINPHFMFNVLESIRMRSVLKGEIETSMMIESLAKLMRRSASWKEDYITLRQELTFAEDYLKLQQYRFGKEFRYKFSIQEECFERKIPSLSLVTFVENACVHGLNRAGHSGSIFIYAYMEAQTFCMEIEDTGVGMEEEQVDRMEELLNHATIEDLQKSESLGMINTMIRLKKYCSENTKISIESEKEGGTCITIMIPKEE